MNIATLPTTLETHSAEETQNAGELFSARLQAGDVICLTGDLGAGKTTWTQGVARALGIENPLSSPTFVLMNEHFSSKTHSSNTYSSNIEKSITLLHLDAYRLEDADEETLRDAGIFDFLQREDAIKIIEWPQFIADYLPSPRYEIAIESVEGKENTRRISFAQTSTR